jgi:hypothetical protein
MGGLTVDMATRLLYASCSPLWLLNRVVRRVWLLHQRQRVAPVYGELERQLGDAALALAWESQMVVGLSRVGILN